jgi:Protein of unknown function (DUF4031)
MAVYIDDARIPARVPNGRVVHDSQWSHLVATTPRELHAFAARTLRLQRAWFQDHWPFPHYDLTAGKREQALAKGAIAIRYGDAEALNYGRWLPPVLVTSSRDGLTLGDVEAGLRPHFDPRKVLISGGARGGDRMAESLWQLWGSEIDRYRVSPDAWNRSRGAGHELNDEMVAKAAKRGGECVALVAPCTDTRCWRTDPHGTHGASHCADQARKAGLTVHAPDIGGQPSAWLPTRHDWQGTGDPDRKQCECGVTAVRTPAAGGQGWQVEFLVPGLPPTPALPPHFGAGDRAQARPRRPESTRQPEPAPAGAQPGTTPPRPAAEYLTRRQREARARDAQAAPEQKPERTPLSRRTSAGRRAAAPRSRPQSRGSCRTSEPNPGRKANMFGRGARAAARERAAQQARQQAEADALFAEADRWAEAAGEPAGFRQEITRERVARVMEQLAGPLVQDARAPEPALAGADRDAEVDRLAELYPEPEVPGDEPGPDAARWAPGPGGAAEPVPVGEAVRDWMADLPEEGRAFLREALGDAIEYRRAEAGDCADCAAEYGGLCYDHAADEMTADRYAARLAQLNAEDKLAAATARLYEAPLPPDGLPRLLDPADEAPRAPEAWALPDGTPHSDPVLAARGWQAHGGVYVRHPQAEREPEAG